jgi:hypothetical protein
MATLIYKGGSLNSQNMNSWYNEKKHYINASKLIDAILKYKRGKGSGVVVVQNKYVFIPPRNEKPLTIKMKWKD